MEIVFRRPEEQDWFNRLSNVPPERFFRSIAAAVGEYLHREIPEEQLASLKIRIEPNVHFKRGYPQYHRPLKDLAGRGMVCHSPYRPLMILIIGYEFIPTAFHEFIHLATPWPVRPSFNCSNPKAFDELRIIEETETMTLEKWIALYWEVGEGRFLFNAEALNHCEFKEGSERKESKLEIWLGAQ